MQIPDFVKQRLCLRMLLRMLSACAPCIGHWANPIACSGQDQDPSNETIAAPLSTEWGGMLFPMVRHSKCAPLSTEGNTGNSVLGVAVPEQHGAEHIRHLVACPMFAQDISGVFGPQMFQCTCFPARVEPVFKDTWLCMQMCPAA